MNDRIRELGRKTTELIAIDDELGERLRRLTPARLKGNAAARYTSVADWEACMTAIDEKQRNFARLWQCWQELAGMQEVVRKGDQPA